MAIDAQITELEKKHRDLDEAIAQELSQPSGDDMKIATLKRLKLHLKDEMEKLRTCGADENQTLH